MEKITIKRGLKRFWIVVSFFWALMVVSLEGFRNDFSEKPLMCLGILILPILIIWILLYVGFWVFSGFMEKDSSEPYDEEKVVPSNDGDNNESEKDQSVKSVLDLYRRDELAIYGKTNTPFTGVTLDTNGLEEKVETHYKNGKRDGLDIVWNKSGIKTTELNFRDGKQHGPATHWHENGIKYCERYYKDGNLDGLYIEWDYEGNKETEQNYKDGKPHGLETEWYENGKKKWEKQYKEGFVDGTWFGWKENGHKGYEERYKNGLKEGLWNEWYKYSDTKMWEGLFKDDEKEGLWTGWYADGNVKYEEHYKNGKLEGLCTWWDEDGKKTEKNFLDGIEQ